MVFVYPIDEKKWGDLAYYEAYFAALTALYDSANVYVDMLGLTSAAVTDSDKTGIMSLPEAGEFTFTESKPIGETATPAQLGRMRETYVPDGISWEEFLEIDAKRRTPTRWRYEKRLTWSPPLPDTVTIAATDRIKYATASVVGPIARQQSGETSRRDYYDTFDTIPMNRVSEVREYEACSQNEIRNRLAELMDRGERQYGKVISQTQLDRIEKDVRKLTPGIAADIARACRVDTRIIQTPVSWEILGGRRAYAPGHAWQTPDVNRVRPLIESIAEGLKAFIDLILVDTGNHIFTASDESSERLRNHIRGFIALTIKQFRALDEVFAYREYMQAFESYTLFKGIHYVYSPIYTPLLVAAIYDKISAEDWGDGGEFLIDLVVSAMKAMRKDEAAMGFEEDAESFYNGRPLPGTLRMEVDCGDGNDQKVIIGRRWLGAEPSEPEADLVGRDAYIKRRGQIDERDREHAREILDSSIGRPELVDPAPAKKMPVLGFAQGSIERLNMSADAPHDYVDTPPYLSESDFAYCVEVRNNSMSPVYKDGDLLFVDPNERVVEGDDVVVEMIEGDEVYGMVKQLTYKSDAFIVLNQYNVPDGIDGSFKVEAPKFGKIHKVVGRQMVKKDRRL